MKRSPSITLALSVLFTLCIGLLAGCDSSSTGGDPGAADAPHADATADASDPGPAELPGDDVRGDAPPSDVPPSDAPPDDATADPGPPPPDPALRLRSEGWLSGDLHMHTAYSDADDPVRIAVALAEYVQSDPFLAFHPEYVGNPIDFIALTDHRTADQNGDPDFHSDKVVLIPGEEFGSPGHAGIWGLSAFVSHDPGGDGSDTADYQAGVDSAHQQGALFGINHPCLPGIPFPWNVRNHDAMEVWNTRWALQGTPVSPTDLADWEAANGPASPFFRRAVQVQDEGGTGQFLRFYEAQLNLGIHVALVGGSDRHTIFAEGFPATWVKAATRDMAGILDGIRARHTFVARTPASATVELSLVVGDATYQMGDAVPLPAGGAEVPLTIRATRAKGARVRLVRGAQVATDEALADAPLGQVAYEAIATSDDFSATTRLVLNPGDWVYPVVHETLIPEGLDPALAAKVPAMAAAATQSSSGETNYTAIIQTLIDYIDPDVVLYPELCDAADWVAANAQCMLADDNGMATFFIPDWIDRILNVLTEGGATSEWSMGAVGSAVRFTPMPEP